MTGTLASLTIGELKKVIISGIGATSALGTLGTIPDMARGLTGFSSTMSLGSLGAIDDMQIGVSGFETTGALGSGGVSPLHYKDVDITGNTSYTDKSVTGYTAYTDIEHSA